jgi:type VI secretion system secreted protein VgrG
VITPLGADKLLLVGYTGQEGLSQLFHFQLEVLAENDTQIAFDQLLGQSLTIRLDVSGDKKRYLNGICNRVSQGVQDEVFTSFGLEIVPQLWLLTRRSQSRIFQHEPSGCAGRVPIDLREGDRRPPGM